MMHLLKANLLLVVRDRQTLFWALAFPLSFVLVFGLFDIGGSPAGVSGVIVDHAGTDLSRSIVEQIGGLDFVDLVSDLDTEEDAREAIRNNDLDFAVVIPAEVGQAGGAHGPVPLRVLYDPANTISNQAVLGTLGRLVDTINLEVTGQPRTLTLDTESVSSEQVEYFDLLLVGLVGMALMVNSIIAIAVKLALYREQNIFKRLLATPLRVSRFFAGFIAAHMALALVQVAVILGVGVLVFKGTIHGNILWLFLVAAVGNIIFLNIGFLVGAYTRTPAAASGFGNVVAMPMMFFSGVFFPVDSLPGFLPQAVRLLPLTPLLDLLRAVAIQGATPFSEPLALALLGGWIVLSSVLAMRLFRFRT